MLVTRIGGPTILVELDGWRILIDPTFDPPGKRYAFGFGTSSTKTRGPALSTEALGPLDVVLLSHDHHADNLDVTGRALLPTACHIITTQRGAQRLGLPQARGLAVEETTLLTAPGKEPLLVTATPCRHGPPWSRRLVGDVIGFAVRRRTLTHHDLWITGDTVLHRALIIAARRLDVDVAIVNAGGVRFPLTGRIRYSMTGADVVKLVGALRARTVISAHYDGWSHFQDGETGMRTAVRNAPPGIRERFRWLPDGEPVDPAHRPHSPSSERTTP